MKILALETATEACSAALWLDGEVVERFEVAPRQHTQLALPMVESLLAETGLSLVQLDAIAFGRGPGAFTGVRIATGLVQGLAFGADLPVVPISTLAALAQGALRIHGASRVLALMDARMQEVYGGYFVLAGEGQVMEAVSTEWVAAPAQMPLPEEGAWFIAGSGWDAYSEAITSRLPFEPVGTDGQLLPHARDVAAIAAREFARSGGVPAEQALPVYLRDRVAEKPGQR